jgi:mRNA-degrading endonuclease toxin of MazEF toxin-antitoxin module
VNEPLRPGDVGLADLNPIIGSEQAGRLPVVVVSGPRI